MHVGTVTIGQIATFLIVLSLGLPISSEAGVLWTEDFENHLTPNWDVTACGSYPQDGCSPAISTDRATSGTHSLKSHYPDQNTQAGTYYNRSNTATNDVWMRFYYYTVNFTYNPTVTKHFFNISSGSGSQVIWLNMWGSREMISAINHPQYVTCPNGTTDVTCNYNANYAHVPLNDGQWYCIETHVNGGTAGVANGSIALYVNGVQTMGYSNLLLKLKDAGYDLVRVYQQYGLGDRYFDDLVVGNTRIGCSGSVSNDVTAPAAPSGLTIR